MNYASIKDRFLALVIDGLLLILPSIASHLVVPIAGPFFISLLYKPVFECSAIQATPGKRFMGILVADKDGKRLTLRAAIIRFVVSYVSGLLFFLGHFVAFLNDKKQTVHDLIAESFVMEGTTSTENDSDSAQLLIQTWTQEIKSIVNKI